MSARVLNPVMISELYKIRSPARKNMPNKAALAKIKRDLFGPVDKEDSKRFVENELIKHQINAADRWGFNFVKGYPINSHKQYSWERVPPTNTIPQMYTLSRAAHVREIPSTSSSSASASASHDYDYDDDYILPYSASSNNIVRQIQLVDDINELIDARADRENFMNSTTTNNTTTNTKPSSTTTTTTTINNLTASSSSASSSGDETNNVLIRARLSVIDAAQLITTAISSQTSCALERQHDELLSAVASSSSSSASSSSTSRVTSSPKLLRSSTREKRQPRITDYLKERKRLAPTPKKLSPAKRMRSSNNTPV